MGFPLQWLLRAARLVRAGRRTRPRHRRGPAAVRRALAAAYLLLTRGLEKRWPAELLGRRLVPDLALGALAGAAYICTVVAALVAGRRLRGRRGPAPTSSSPAACWSPGLGAAIFEEILFRGVLFRIVEEGLGTWAALLISALVFGFVHIGNPGATVWSSVAIAIEAGLLLGMAYQVTRSLPLVIGLHAAWNFTQGSVFGSAVSGTSGHALLAGAPHQRTGLAHRRRVRLRSIRAGGGDRPCGRTGPARGGHATGHAGAVAARQAACAGRHRAG